MTSEPRGRRGTLALVRSALALAILLVMLSAGSAGRAQSDLRYAYPQQLSVSPLGVNLQTGRFTQSVTDVAIGDLQFVRSWGDGAYYKPSSRMFGTIADNTSFRTGWVHNFSNGLYFDNRTNDTLQASIGGVAYRYRILTSQYGTSYVPANRTARGSSLVASGAIFTLTTAAGDEHRFTDIAAPNSGVAAPINYTVRADGTRWDYDYDGAGRLHQVRSSRGYALILDYDGSGNVAAACGVNLAIDVLPTASSCTGRPVRAQYGYSANGNELRTITDAANAVVTITGYAPMGGPLCITQPNSTTCAIANSYGLLPGEPALLAPPPDAVRTQVTPGGGTWTYSYELGENIQDYPIVPGRPRWSSTVMQDPNGLNTILRYDRGVLVDVDSPGGQFNYKYENLVFTSGNVNFDYHAISPTLATLPGGRREYYQYDDRGNLLRHSSWPEGAPEPMLTTGTFMLSQTDPDLRSCCTTPGTAVIPAGASTFQQYFPAVCGASVGAKICNQPLAQIDANGNQTDFTYSSDHGGILTETGPADANGVRPQTRYTYVQRSAWLRTSGGGYAASPYPVWLLASRSSCRTTAAAGNGCAGGATDEVVTLYEYGPDAGPNNLLLRGMVEDANGAALRTCYAYDTRGNRISETRPGGTANLTVCP